MKALKIIGNVVCVWITLGALITFVGVLFVEPSYDIPDGEIYINQYELTECSQPVGFDDSSREGFTKIYTVDYTLNNTTNVSVALWPGSHFYYYYFVDGEEDEYPHNAEVLKKESQILESYNNAILVPGGETGRYTEYIAVPENACRIQIVNYPSNNYDDDNREEYYFDL